MERKIIEQMHGQQNKNRRQNGAKHNQRKNTEQIQIHKATHFGHHRHRKRITTAPDSKNTQHTSGKNGHRAKKHATKYAAKYQRKNYKGSRTIKIISKLPWVH